MSGTSKTRSSFSLRGLFGLSEGAQLKNRVMSLNSPVVVTEERESIPCEVCGFGKMFPAPIGENGAVRFLCERRDCRFVCDRPGAEVIAAKPWTPSYTMQAA